jgi:VWFA-related protein
VWLRPRKLIVLTVAAAAVLAPASRASVGASTRDPAPAGQAPAPGQAPAVPTFGVSTELVYVRFHVETKAGYVRDVKREQIRVLEDGKEQKIALLETPSSRERTVAPEVTLALDVSGSVMDARLLDEQLLRDVLFATLNEQATVGLCAFGGELRCPVAPTRDVDALLNGFRESMEFGYQQRNTGTRLYRSLADIASAPAKGEKVQRALVVFSDGLENRGGKLDEAIRAAADADVRVYAIKLSQGFREQAIAAGPFGAGSRGGGPGGGGFGGAPGRAYYDYKKLELDELAEKTGGRTFEPGTLEPAVLADILRKIATEITMECVVGYAPEGAQTGKRRRVKVELVDKSIGKIPDGERTFAR